MLAKKNSPVCAFDFIEQPRYILPEIVDIDSVIALPPDFRLAAGDRAPAELRCRLVGPEGAPVIVVLGGISADRHTIDALDGAPGWWRKFAGAGRAIDIRKYRILSFDYITPDAPVAERIPAVSTLDQARVLAFLLDHLGLARVRCFIGSSYGGMIGLAFAAAYPGRLDHLIAISAGDYPHPMATAWRTVQRQIVRLGLKSGQARAGLALARQLAMTTYRSHEEFAARFSSIPACDGAFPVEGYLKAQGNKFTDRMSPERFLALSLSIDLHHVDATAITAPVTLIASTSDQIVPPGQMQRLAKKIPGPCSLAAIPSVFGHDAFLKETGGISPIIIKTLEELPV